MLVAADLPVAVALRGALGREVTTYVESDIGWHVVAGDGPLLPALAVAERVVAGTPTVVVAPAPVAPDVVRAAFLDGALDVIAWPDERHRLADLRLDTARPSGERVGVPVLRVAGCRGGVGTSTVALAAGATVAWSSGRALVVGDNATLRLAGFDGWTGPGSSELLALGERAAGEVERVAQQLPAVPGLRVLGGGGNVGDTAAWPFDLVVVDAGRNVAGADLVVGMADASLANAPPHAPVVVVQHGPMDRRGVKEALGRAPAGWLAYSARVARAGCNGRVPSSLPGAWVAGLRAALERVA